jgi:flavodoxin I
MTVLATAKVGIFYSTGTGNTKRVANLIKVHLGDSADVPQPVSASHARDFEGYDAIIFGAPSYMWEKHRVSALDFDTIEPPFDDFKDLKGKKVAIFGLGNQAEYRRIFVMQSGYSGSILVCEGQTWWGRSRTKDTTSSARGLSSRVCLSASL